MYNILSDILKNNKNNMTIYIYKDVDKEIIANQMEDVENVSYRETMVKFHASSIAPAIKVMLEKDKNFNLPCNDEIINQVALMFAKQSYNELSKESVDGKLKNIFQKELNKKEQIRLLKGGSTYRASIIIFV